MKDDKPDTAAEAFKNLDKAKSTVKKMVGQAIETPIHDDQREMEDVILSALALSANSETSDLKYDLLAMDPADFFFADHRMVFRAMKELDRKGDHVDQVTISQLLGGGYQDVLTSVFIGSMPAESKVKTYRQRIMERADVRQLSVIGQNFMKAIDAGDIEDRAGMVAGLQKAVSDFATTKRLVPDVQTEADILENFIIDLENIPTGYPTGFTHLDRVIGGLRPGLFVIAAPPSAGKTTFVKQLADQAAASKDAPSVLFFTYEQSAFDIRVKTLARLTKTISNELIKSGEAKGPHLERAIADYKRFGKRLKIIEGDRHHTVGTIHLMAQRELHRTGKPPVIVVDYLQAMPVSDPDLPDRRSQIDFIITGLRRVARDTGASIVAVSSMARQQYDQAKMDAFKESGGIEYGADVAAIMSVDNEDGSGTTRDITLVVLKNRHGRRGTVSLTYTMTVDTFVSNGCGFTSYVDAVKKTKTTRGRRP